MDSEFLNELAKAIKRRSIEGNVGDLNYRIGSKDVRGNINLDDATIRGLIGYDGTAQLNAQSPLFGGHVNFDANHALDGNNYHLAYDHPIDGGNINFDASRSKDGNNRFYLQFKKQF